LLGAWLSGAVWILEYVADEEVLKLVAARGIAEVFRTRCVLISCEACVGERRLSALSPEQLAAKNLLCRVLEHCNAASGAFHYSALCAMIVRANRSASFCSRQSN